MSGRARSAVPDSDTAAAPEHFNSRWLGARLRALIGPPRGARLCIAFSGGLDSSVLLAALASLRARQGFVLRALHVDHGLHAESRHWAAAARAQARRLGIGCGLIRLRIAARRGESLEALAREARYRALLGRLRRGEHLLTAHHQDDQFETVLLALLRGSGVRGLAGMSARSTLGQTLLLRPLLPVSRAQLERFARRRSLEWSEDTSNLDPRFDRNYLRRLVLPPLYQRWPAAAASVSRSAAHLAEAQALLERAARRGAARAADGAALRISALRALPLPQRRNLLRVWIASHGLRLPDQRRLREIAGPMLEARADALPRVHWRGGELRRLGDRLLALPSPAGGLPAPAARAIEAWDWRRSAWLELADGAALGLMADRHGNVDLSALPCPLRVDFRHGGERLQASHGRVPLKDLLQSEGIEPWQRSSVPLLCDRARIVAVADLWLDAAFRATDASGGPRGRLRWRRSPSSDRD